MITKERGSYIYIRKIYFKSKIIIRDNESHCIMTKVSLCQENIRITNIYVPNVKVPKYTKQMVTDLMEEIDSNTIIVGNTHTPLSKWIVI